MRVVTRAEFDAAAAGDAYYAGRWPYLARAAEVLAAHADVAPADVLELGAYRLPLVPGCETMDCRAELDPTWLHDARVTPWPQPDGRYEVFVATQVFEHLGGPASGAQERAFAEAVRVTRRLALLSLPYQWARAAGWHGGIDLPTIVRWAGGRRPATAEVVGDGQPTRRIICTWDLAAPAGRA